MYQAQEAGGGAIILKAAAYRGRAIFGQSGTGAGALAPRCSWGFAYMAVTSGKLSHCNGLWEEWGQGPRYHCPGHGPWAEAGVSFCGAWGSGVFEGEHGGGAGTLYGLWRGGRRGQGSVLGSLSSILLNSSPIESATRPKPNPIWGRNGLKLSSIYLSFFLS